MTSPLFAPADNSEASADPLSASPESSAASSGGAAETRELLIGSARGAIAAQVSRKNWSGCALAGEKLGFMSVQAAIGLVRSELDYLLVVAREEQDR